MWDLLLRGHLPGLLQELRLPAPLPQVAVIDACAGIEFAQCSKYFVVQCENDVWFLSISMSSGGRKQPPAGGVCGAQGSYGVLKTLEKCLITFLSGNVWKQIFFDLLV